MICTSSSSYNYKTTKAPATTGVHGRPATAQDLSEPFEALGKRFGGKVKALLYGGSVNLNNAEELLGINHVQGLFVGRTAWELPGYTKLLEIASQYRETHS